MMRMSPTGDYKQLAAFKDDAITVRVAAVRSLEQQGETTALESLVAALNDSAWEVRAAAVWALGKFGEQAPLEPLVARMNDEHTDLREAARMALEQSHPEALSAISIDPIMITQASGSNTASSVREQKLHPSQGS